MCLILFAHQCHRDLPLVILANRDEFLGRPTAAAAPWTENPAIIGGRDLVAGGGWFAAGSDGRWAAVTNVREGEHSPSGAPSRGWLVRDFMLGACSPADFARRLVTAGADYAGFNLLLGDSREIWFASNRQALPAQLPAGLYGLSNGRLDTPWPKIERGKTGLAALLASPHPEPEHGFRLLADRDSFPDQQLPATGIPLAWERILSATFIMAPEQAYGTRSSTVLLRARRGQQLLVERTFAGPPWCWSQRSYQIRTGR